MPTFQPMLSASLDGVDLSTLQYPLYGSPKLDGFRCILKEGVCYTRNMKPFRNKHVQSLFGDLHGLDGELIVGSPNEGNVRNRTSSGVTAYSGTPDVKLYVFDSWDTPGGWEGRYTRAQETINESSSLSFVPHLILHTPADVGHFEERILKRGYEGIMLRSVDGPYKYGRSTLNEGYLMKLKRFTDGEGHVVGVVEAMQNNNELQKDEIGRAKRTSHRANLEGNGMVGVILITDDASGLPMRLAPGIMTHAERVHFFKHPEDIVARRVHWRGFGYGVKDAMLFPRFYGFEED